MKSVAINIWPTPRLHAETKYVIKVNNQVKRPVFESIWAWLYGYPWSILGWESNAERS